MVRLTLTSLLNLGGGDQQVDDSFTFMLRDASPFVERVQVTSGGKKIYDSETGLIEGALSPDGVRYLLQVTVAFSEPVNPSLTMISAGPRAPYDSHRVSGLRWSERNRVVEGELEFPVSAAAGVSA